MDILPPFSSSFALLLPHWDLTSPSANHKFIRIIDNKKDNLIDLVTLNDCINFLTPKEKLLIDLRFYKDLSQKDVANKFNVSQVQISRLEKQVIDKLKQYF